MHSKVVHDLVAKIRETIKNSLGDESLDYMGINEPLIQSGLISSLDIKHVTLDLE